ncbi:MAG: hypothetical protein HOH43_08935 [Candidatus Latescibacteria bacterium]|nr:hypothetical protein [Candidatus Latescibacterota bacterium]
MDRAPESIYLLDMTRCEPSNAIDIHFGLGKWTAVAYSISAGAGRMLFSGPDTQAPPIRLDLGVRGWYHIFIATYRHHVFPDYMLLLKLTSDKGYTRSAVESFRANKDLVPPEMVLGSTDLSEAYWKSADLTGESIIFHRPEFGLRRETTANIAYVRLTPMSDREIANAQQQAKPGDRRLIANYDGGQNSFWAPASDQEMKNEFQAMDQSDFKTVLWGCARSFATYYPSRVASLVAWSFGLPGIMRAGRQAIERQQRSEFDPLRSAIECAHEIGIDIYPQVRMIGEQLPPNHIHYTGPGAFQKEHPEYRCISPSGNPTRHLSQAFEPVRAKYVALFREWVEDYLADGVCIVFNRSWPYVLYEKPVLDSFMDKYGFEMKSVDPYDERVLAHRASFLTELLRETRQMLDAVGASQGRRLKTAYVIPAVGLEPEGCPDLGPFTTPRSHAMDIETWIKDALVDHLIVNIQHVGDPKGIEAREILRPYITLARGTPTEIYADLYPRRQSADSMRIRAMECYDEGVDGLCFWDCQARSERLSGWAMHKKLGQKESLAHMKPFADALFKREQLLTLDGYDVTDEFGLPSDG